MSNKLSTLALAKAIEQSMNNFGKPDVLYASPVAMSSLYKQLSYSDNTSETAIRVRAHFSNINLYPDNSDMKDYDIMMNAVKAFARIGLDKTHWSPDLILIKGL